MKVNGKILVNCGVVILLALFISGCLGETFSSKPEEETSETQTKSRKTTAVYYDFEDVLIPMGLKIVDSKTVVVSTPGSTSGIIALKGRAERQSLFNFFGYNMQKDNWSILSQIKSPGTTIMVFQKSSRIAVITIRSEQIYTYVEIGVAPSAGGSETGAGFSEPILIE